MSFGSLSSMLWAATKAGPQWRAPSLLQLPSPWSLAQSMSSEPAKVRPSPYNLAPCAKQLTVFGIRRHLVLNESSYKRVSKNSMQGGVLLMAPEQSYLSTHICVAFILSGSMKGLPTVATEDQQEGYGQRFHSPSMPACLYRH